ncbi:inhibin beta A chain [Agrilus planipennis]|uniref:Inhibin beta A chain n=1 Tax=Agrilus planipennis TaxID=224129 RepID=A0A1W4WRH3_AGRPL|nr:inhibin beta A chain [Agrilus planipennis]
MGKQEIEMFRVAFLVAILCNFVGVSAGYISIFGPWFDSSPSTSSTPSPTSEPNGMARSRQHKYTITEEQLTAIRIEYIKNQILRKLRLKHKPSVSKAFLPKLVIESNSILPKVQDDSSNLYFDDFYGKTTQAVVFPYEDEAKCVRKVQYPSACLPFVLPKDVHASEVSTAELWVYKKADSEDIHNQTFIVSEIAHWDAKKSFQKTTPIYINQTTVTEGWLTIDVTQIVKNWLDNKSSLTHAINVACKTCSKDVGDSPISFKLNDKPFVVIHTHSQQKRTVHRRTKRHVNCYPGVTDCCRESLYISFADIGWDDWIISPSGYNAYFCKGSCNSATAKTLSASQHNSILQKVMYDPNRNSGNRLELTTCCAATQFQPLQLFYMDNNKTITSKILSNMIVETCGCM